MPQDLGKLDIASTVPAYVPEQQQIEDPTPTTAQAATEDPLAAAGKAAKKRNNSFESEVRSPGGGSIRTAGPDLLNAILGHIDEDEEGGGDGDEPMEGEGEGMKRVETTVHLEEDKDGKEEAQKEADAPRDVTKDDDEGGDDETMERIELPDRTKGGFDGADDGKPDEKKATRDEEQFPEVPTQFEPVPEADETGMKKDDGKTEDLAAEQKDAPAGVA